MDKEKIIQFTLGNISDPSEKEVIAKQILEDKTSRDFYISIKNAHALSKKGIKHIDHQTEYKKLSEKIRFTGKRFIRPILRYAAIFIAIAGLSVPLVKYMSADSETELNEFTSPAGQISELILPDSTHVWLNSNSRLSYPAEFSKKTRDVTLSGEAFFDVVKNQSRPFTVKTSDINIRVTGTSFNVKAFPEANEISTTLVEGAVVLEKEQEEGLLTLAVLKANDHAVYTVKEQRLTHNKDVNTDLFTAWIDGKLVFQEELLDSVAVKLSRKYKVKIEVHSDELKKLRFTGTFTDESLNEVLNLLKLSSPIEYKIDNNVQSGDSLYKQIVYITSKN